MPVTGMHFVCRDDANVIEHGDGTFDSGFWEVAPHHCDSVTTIALHHSKGQPSYRQGRVIGWREATYQGATRVVFTVQEDGNRRSWAGGGGGEKGYTWSS